MVGRSLLSFGRDELSDVLVTLQPNDGAVADNGALAGTSPGFLCSNVHL
jgi:hypothetical protein